MLDDVKARAKKAKQFVQDHKTTTACVVTAVVTAHMTRNRFIKQVYPYVWQKGWEYGRLTVECEESAQAVAAAYTFINEKGLTNEFVEFVAQA